MQAECTFRDCQLVYQARRRPDGARAKAEISQRNERARAGARAQADSIPEAESVRVRARTRAFSSFSQEMTELAMTELSR